jgi:transforming growth factor-beta-induced protein
LTDANLISVMKGPGPYTVFAPTDEAFAKVPKGVLDGLAKDKAKLQEVLKYHVLTSKWTSDDIKRVPQTGTAQGQVVKFAASGGTITVNDAKVIKSDIDCSNGMVHVIDAVLLPPQ